jgi:cytochrome c oxidase subunit 3
MNTQPVLDVSDLPPAALDARSLGWWGNTLLMAIETTTVALLVVSYLYLWRNYTQSGWPPPRVDRDPPLLAPVPGLLYATLNTALLLASCGLMAWVDRGARRQFAELDRLRVATPSAAPAEACLEVRPAGLLLGLFGLTLLAAAAFILRLYEFPGLKVSWNDNAYASLVWSILGLHLSYILVGVIELAALVSWVALYGLDENQSIEITLTATYWYWTVGSWVVLYGLVYWFPRVA